MVEPTTYHALGLSDAEYSQIETILKRPPSTTELAMFSVEWSEHCGYPRSRKYLKLLPQTGRYPTLVGEDAGGIIVDDLALIFKMESHNHPSQVEPRQGAATGVGGIIRDIFTSGARPIASLDSLRFGELNDPFQRYLFGGVVSGISFYGNCIGVPTVGGEVYFDDAYAGNCLVNVMSLGIAKKDCLVRARAEGVGNSILYVGSATGRDGIGGCSVLASKEFREDLEMRPTVQIGDPFTEKCLIEATLEAIASGNILGIKDMGAAGLTCSTAEMAAAGGVGVDIDLEKVPLREEGMEPWEIMMSESQERMLACVKKGKEESVKQIFRKWDLEAAEIGTVTDAPRVRIYHHREVVAEIPTAALASPPLHDMPFTEPEYIKEARAVDLSRFPPEEDYSPVLLKLLAEPTVASKAWVWRQYDHQVGTNTVVLPGAGDAAVLRIKESPKGIALTVDGNSLYCYLNPYRGAQIAVAEAARNLVCVGADPAALTDCLNFGNPEKPDRFWQFKNCVEGIAEICRFLGIAVVSGNVSFYNESPSGSIPPTPTIGMVGIIDDLKKRVTLGFKDEGDLIILLGENGEELGGSIYLKAIHRRKAGDAPRLDFSREKAVQAACAKAIQRGLVNSAHDCSEGGLAVALAECALYAETHTQGAAIDLEDKISDLALLFGESQSRIILTLKPDDYPYLQEIAQNYEVPLKKIGTVGGDRLIIKKMKRTLVDVKIDTAKKCYHDAIPRLMEG